MILTFSKEGKITLEKKTQQGPHKGKTILKMSVELYLFTFHKQITGKLFAGN